MPKDNFKTRLREQPLRTDLGKKFTRVKRQARAKDRDSHCIVARYGNDSVRVDITTGSRPYKESTSLGRYNLKRTRVEKTLEKFIKGGHESFFKKHVKKHGIRQSRSYFILYKEQLCDLKAIVHVTLGQASNPHSPEMAKALQELGFTYVHFIFSEESSKNLEIIHLEGGREKDGLRYGRGGGEGKNHKSLREWVMKNPHLIMKKIDVESDTEVQLPSGDLIDVAYRTPDGRQIVAIEVKSKDSDEHDLRRGIYQCVKYRAVLCAQNCAEKVRDCSVRSLLVTEEKLVGDLRKIAEALDIELWVTCRKDGKIRRLVRYLG